MKHLSFIADLNTQTIDVYQTVSRIGHIQLSSQGSIEYIALHEGYAERHEREVKKAFYQALVRNFMAERRLS